MRPCSRRARLEIEFAQLDRRLERRISVLVRQRESIRGWLWRRPSCKMSVDEYFWVGNWVVDSQSLMRSSARFGRVFGDHSAEPNQPHPKSASKWKGSHHSTPFRLKVKRTLRRLRRSKPSPLPILRLWALGDGLNPCCNVDIKSLNSEHTAMAPISQIKTSEIADRARRELLQLLEGVSLLGSAGETVV
jgi:hypothetical protein